MSAVSLWGRDLSLVLYLSMYVLVDVRATCLSNLHFSCYTQFVTSGTTAVTTETVPTTSKLLPKPCDMITPAYLHSFRKLFKYMDMLPINQVV